MGKRTTTTVNTSRTVEREGPVTKRTTTTVSTKLPSKLSAEPKARAPSMKGKRLPP